MRRITRSTSTRLVVVATSMVLMASAFAAWTTDAFAGAVSARFYDASVSPTADTAGATTLYTLTLKNDASSSSTSLIGSADWTIPSSYTPLSLECIPAGQTTVPTSPVSSCSITTSSGHAWTVTLSGSTLQWRATGGTQKMTPGEFATVGVWTQAGCTSGTAHWGGTLNGGVLSNLTVKPSTDMSGGSVFAFKSGTLDVTIAPGANSPTKLKITGVSGLADPLQFDSSSTPGSLYLQTGETGVKIAVQAQTSSGTAATVCTPIAVTLLKGTSSAAGSTSVGSGTINAGQDTVSIDLSVDSTAQNYTLWATATGLTSDTANVFIQTQLVIGSGNIITTGSGGSGGLAATSTTSSTSNPEDLCDTTSTNTTCVTVLLPNGTNGNQLLSLGSCDTLQTNCKSLLFTFLADLKTNTGGALYSRSNPFTVIIECDRTACKGGGVSSYVVNIDANNSGNFVQSPACVSADHTIVDPSLATDFCTDYVASHRDNAQDLILYVRMGIDAKGRI